MTRPDSTPTPAPNPAPTHAPPPAPAADDMATRRADLARLRGLSEDAARPEAVARQHARAEMTARARAQAFCDPGTFREIGGLARDEDAAPGEKPADGMICGIGRAEGRPVVLVSQDFTVEGGSSGVIGSVKLEHAARRAMREGCPLVMLLDGGGHRISSGQDSRHYAWANPLFHDLARMSGWVPMAAAILGAGFAAPTNYAALADFVVMVRGRSYMGLSGPALVKAGVGEVIDKETLGGASAQVDRHGLADLAVDTEAEALGAIRDFLAYLPSNARAEPALRPAPAPDPAAEAARAEALASLVPANTRRAYDVRKVVEGIVDPGTVFEMKPSFARNAVCAFARLEGRPVGILANQALHLGGMLTAAACEKMARHVATCDAYGLPLIYLIDVPGFFIGSGAEKTQLGRRSAKLIAELGQATVPRVSVVLRKGYGLGYFAMCGGRSFDSDASFAWPTAEICAMSIEGAVEVIHRREFAAAEDPAAARAARVAEMRTRVTPFGGAEGFGLDDAIDPSETRARLLEILARAPARRDLFMPPKFRAIPPI